MDKETLSNYGWVVIVIIILCILLGLATPFGGFIKDATMNALDALTTRLEDSVGVIPEEPTNYSEEDINADEHIIAIGKNDPSFVVAVFNSDYSAVTVSKNGNGSDGLMMAAVSTNRPMYDHRTTLKSVTISEGVKNVGASMFMGCNAVNSAVKLPSSVTTVEKGAFANCTNLPSIEFGSKVTSIGISAFANDISLHSLSLPSSLVSIGSSAFGSCIGLSGDLIIPSSVKTIGAMAFQSDRGFNGKLVLNEGLEHLGDFAFNQCVNFTNTSLTIPSTVTSIGGDMVYTVGLKTTNNIISDYIISSAYATDYINHSSHVFYNFATKTIKAYDVPAQSNSFSSIDGVLYNKDVTRLVAYPASREGSSYEIPEGVTIIDEMAFSRTSCGSATNQLKSITLPDSYTITTGDDQFVDTINRAGENSLVSSLYHFVGLTDINVKSTNTKYKTIDHCLYSADETTLYYVPLEYSGTLNIPEGVTTIAQGVFAPCVSASELQGNITYFRQLTGVNFPSTLTIITDYDLQNLNNLVKDNLNNGTLTVADSNVSFATAESGTDIIITRK